MSGCALSILRSCSGSRSAEQFCSSSAIDKDCQLFSLCSGSIFLHRSTLFLLVSYTLKSENSSLTFDAPNRSGKKIVAPSRYARKTTFLRIPNLGAFAQKTVFPIFCLF